MSVGALNACALLDGGTVRCWGHGDSGNLGNGQKVNTFASVEVQNIRAAVAISSGAGFNCALENGNVKCWGKNNVGQLGDGTTKDSPTPVTVVGL